MQVLFYILLFILGACFGSFLCCEARRLHYREVNKSAKKLSPRSLCMHCKYQLKWYDNIPIVSWLILRGKCRKCHHKIGLAEIISELTLALGFLFLGFTIDITTASLITWFQFAILLIFVIIISFLAIYDGLYGELPTRFLTIAIIVAIISLIIKEITILQTSPFSYELVIKPLLSILILGGLYLALYIISKGKWVGDGDWLLGTALAIVLYEPWLALLTLCLANILACLVMAPAVIKRKNHQIYFGPFMVAAFVIVCCLADFLQHML
ncbi:prepilin peptidase [Candidatus Saccharibacteria bacterium]|nr:prepilin peptidase [Candidatus Saccharibacteria bacterium]